MNHQESSHHHPEIARLNGIIDILVAQNKALLEEIALLKNRIAPRQAISSLDESRKGIPDVISSHDKNEKGILEVVYSHDKSENGSIEAISSHDKNEKGNIEAISSNEKINKGINGETSSIEKNIIGINDDNNPHDKIVKGISGGNTPVPENVAGINDAGMSLPAFVEPSPDMLGKLSFHLNAAGIKKVKSSTLSNMAQIILRAHNKQDCSHRALRQATGLSNGGIAKLLMSMKKHGLIYRAEFKRFGLLQKAQQILKEAQNAH